MEEQLTGKEDVWLDDETELMAHDSQDGRTSRRFPHSGDADEVLDPASDTRGTRARVRTIVQSFVEHEADCKDTEAVETTKNTKYFAPY